MAEPYGWVNKSARTRGLRSEGVTVRASEPQPARRRAVDGTASRKRSRPVVRVRPLVSLFRSGLLTGP